MEYKKAFTNTMNQTLKWKKLNFVECGENYSINLGTAEIRNDKTGRILKHNLQHKDGYYRVNLYLNGKHKYYMVHILFYTRMLFHEYVIY